MNLLGAYQYVFDAMLDRVPAVLYSTDQCTGGPAKQSADPTTSGKFDVMSYYDNHARIASKTGVNASYGHTRTAEHQWLLWS